MTAVGRFESSGFLIAVSGFLENALVVQNDITAAEIPFRAPSKTIKEVSIVPQIPGRLECTVHIARSRVLYLSKHT